jgi:putative flippase GtrA
MVFNLTWSDLPGPILWLTKFEHVVQSIVKICLSAILILGSTPQHTPLKYGRLFATSIQILTAYVLNLVWCPYFRAHSPSSSHHMFFKCVFLSTSLAIHHSYIGTCIILVFE